MNNLFETKWFMPLVVSIIVGLGIWYNILHTPKSPIYIDGHEIVTINGTRFIIERGVFGADNLIPLPPDPSKDIRWTRGGKTFDGCPIMYMWREHPNHDTCCFDSLIYDYGLHGAEFIYDSSDDNIISYRLMDIPF